MKTIVTILLALCLSGPVAPQSEGMPGLVFTDWDCGGCYVHLMNSQQWQKWREMKAREQYRDPPSDDGRNNFRVVANPGTPSSLRYANSYTAVVLKDEKKKVVVRPVRTEELPLSAGNALGATVNYHGLIAEFAPEDLERIRSLSPDREFFITVVSKFPDRTVIEVDYKVKKKHFGRLQ